MSPVKHNQDDNSTQNGKSCTENDRQDGRCQIAGGLWSRGRRRWFGFGSCHERWKLCGYRGTRDQKRQSMWRDDIPTNVVSMRHSRCSLVYRDRPDLSRTWRAINTFKMAIAARDWCSSFKFGSHSSKITNIREQKECNMQCKCSVNECIGLGPQKERRPAAKREWMLERERRREEKRRRREERVLEWRTSVNIIQRLLYRTGTPYSLYLRISPLSLNLEHPEFRWSIVIVIVSVFTVCLSWSTNISPLLIYLLTLECKKNCTKQGDGKTPPRPHGATLSSSVRNPCYQPITERLPLRLEECPSGHQRWLYLVYYTVQLLYSVYPCKGTRGFFFVFFSFLISSLCYIY
jgi:hypothetical protein